MAYRKRTDRRSTARPGNPRPLVVVGSVLAGTVLLAGVGTVRSEVSAPRTPDSVAAEVASATPAHATGPGGRGRPATTVRAVAD